MTKKDVLVSIMISVGFNARHLADPEIRGLTRYTVELLRAFSRRDGLRLVLFTDRRPYPGHLEGVNAELVVFDSPRQLLWESVALARKIGRSRIDVFHAPADRGLPLVKVCPLVVTVHDSYERSHWRSLIPGGKRRLRYWFHEAVNYFLSDAVITVSDSTRKELVSLGVVPGRKLIRIYNGVPRRFNPVGGPGDSEALARHGVQPPFMLYVGGYDPRKNVDGLIKGFEQSGLSDFRLVIIARKTADLAKRMSAWKRLVCFERIRFLEVADEELPCFYRSAEFFVNPSLWESFSLQLAEAMACGTPVICSNRKAMPEIVGDAGICFDPGDDAALPAAMRLMAADAPLRSNLRDRGLKKAATLSWENAAEQTLRVYQKVVNNSGT